MSGRISGQRVKFLNEETDFVKSFGDLFVTLMVLVEVHMEQIG